MAKEDRQWPVMLEEEARCRRCLYVPLMCRRVGNRVDSSGGVCGSRAHLPATGLGGLGC